MVRALMGQSRQRYVIEIVGVRAGCIEPIPCPRFKVMRVLPIAVTFVTSV